GLMWTPSRQWPSSSCRASSTTLAGSSGRGTRRFRSVATWSAGRGDPIRPRSVNSARTCWRKGSDSPSTTAGRGCARVGPASSRAMSRVDRYRAMIPPRARSCRSATLDFQAACLGEQLAQFAQGNLVVTLEDPHAGEGIILVAPQVEREHVLGLVF